MRPRRLTVGGLLTALALTVVPLVDLGAEPEDPRAQKGMRLPIPSVPPSILEAIQEGRFGDAAEALTQLETATANTADRAYVSWIRAGTMRLAGRLDDSRGVLAAAIEADRTGPWSAKLRASLAAVHLAQGHAAEAEALARAEVVTLLAADRKDRLAGVYRDFARRLLQPEDPLVRPDPEAAHALLLQARSLAKGVALRATLFTEAAAASRKANQVERAIKEYQDYLKTYSEGDDRDSVRFALADAQNEAGHALEARLGWSDLARELASRKPPASPALRAKALYNVARTYGAPVAPARRDMGFRTIEPTPPPAENGAKDLPEIRPAADDPTLVLQVAALRRVLEAAPDHPLAVKAAFEIGRVSQGRGKSEQALAAFRAFLEGQGFQAESPESKRLRDELTARALLEMADVLRSQGKFAEAIASYNAFLAKNANGLGSSRARRSILEVQLARAGDLFDHAKYEDARTAWQAFVAENPLDDLVPDVLLHVGEALREVGKLDEAIASFDALINRFPTTEAGQHARFALGMLYEVNRGTPELAIEQYRKVTHSSWANQARERMTVMETPALGVVTPRTFRKAEPAQLVITTRNIERLSFTAYRLDPEAFFRKKLALKGVESLDVGLVAPDAQWTEPVPGYAKYKPIESTYALEPLDAQGAGFWAVKVTDEKALQATTMVLRGDLEAIVTSSREQVLVFSQDMATGRGRAGARVLVSDGTETVQEFVTGADGVVIQNWEAPRTDKSRLEYLVLDGDVAAGSGLTLSDQMAQGLTARAYLFTERPAYQPGQEVSLRGVVREVQDGRYSVAPGATYSLQIDDSKGRRIVSQAVELSEFGTFHTLFSLVEGAPVGTYSIRLFQPSRSSFTGAFEVQSYTLEKADLRIELARPIVFRGETVQANFAAKYAYGAPLAGRPIRVNLPDGRIVSGLTDAAGEFPVEFSTEGFAEEGTLELRGSLPEDGVSSKANFRMAVRAFRIDLATDRTVYLEGESFALRALTLDALGTPTGQSLRVSVLKRVMRGNSELAEREVSTTRITTDPKTGRGEVTIKVDDPDGGSYLLRTTGNDRFGNAVVEDRAVAISGSRDATKLRILTDRQSYKVGEPARVNLHNRAGAGRALVTWQADRILSYRLVDLVAGDNALGWDVIGDQFPNFTLSAARLEAARLDTARLDVRVERDLQVNVKPEKAVLGPGEDVVLDVTATDQLGKPVAAEFSVAMVDRALLRIYEDNLPPIGPFFFDQTRTGAFTTSATNGFRYAPTAKPVTGAVASAKPGPSRVPNPATASLAEAPVVPGPDEPPGADRDRPSRKRPVYDFDLAVGASDPRSRAIIARLNQVVSIPFGRETSLEDVVKYLKTATIDREMPNGLPIYVDRDGLQEAEKTMQSPVVLELEGIPLRKSLHLLLKQLDLTYQIDDGLLTFTYIGSRDREEAEMEYEQSVMASRMGGMGGGGMAGMGGGGMGGMGGGMAGMAAGPPGDDRQEPTTSAPESIQEKPRPSDPERPLPREIHRSGEAAEKAVAEGKEQAPARQQFVETAYWNPAVVTGDDGRAQIRFKAPSALSEYVLTARGVTGADTLAGQTTAELTVRKDLFVDFRTPAVLVQGDKPRFSARVHHVGVRGKVEVRLALYAGGRERVEPKTIEVQADGVDAVLFEPFEVPAGDVVRLVLALQAGERSDEVVSEIPIRPRGVQDLATASGTSGDDATAFVTLPEGRTYEHPEMLVMIAPSTERLLVDLATGREDSALGSRGWSTSGQGRLDTTAARASELLGAASALKALKSLKTGPVEIERLTQRVGALAASLVTTQNEDGGWPWVQTGPSDRRVTARVVWALSEAEATGALPDTAVLSKPALLQELTRSDSADIEETRAALLFALALRGKAGFEAVNALNRARNDLPDPALAYLALTFARLERPAMANEVLAILARRARTEAAAGPGRPALRYWSGGGNRAGASSPVESTALAALAFAQIEPGAEVLEGAIAWLDARRCGTRWSPRQVSGTAVAALAAYHARGRSANDRYRLTVSVNEVEVFKTDVAGPSEGRTIAVPLNALKPNGKNRVDFDIEGRGTFSYSVALSGFTRDLERRADAVRPPFGIRRRVYLAAAPEFEGHVLESGFRAVSDDTSFENVVTQVPLGGRARVVIDATAAQPAADRDYLILEEPLPAGATVVAGSIQSNADFTREANGLLTFYFAPNRGPESVSYEMYGDQVGEYRALPARLTSAEDPGRYDLGAPGALRVLAPGEKSSDAYRPTPDELLARGRFLFDAGRLKEAAEPLEALAAGFALRDEVRKDLIRMLLYVHLETYEPRKVVADFEAIREKSPELVIPFDKLLIIGRAYADMGEHERAYLGWRALAESSYLEDSLVGEALRQRGQTLESASFLLELWREYPDEASIESDFFGLSQLYAGLAPRAESDPDLKVELARAGVNRSDLLAQAVLLVRAFLAQSPRSPLADEAGLAWIGDELERKDYRAVVQLAERFARLYPKSPLIDRFQYSRALGHFQLGEYEEAQPLARGLAETGDESAPNRAQAIYLLGQIYEASKRPGESLAYYRQVADKFTDAAEAANALTRRVLALPEISVVRPGAAGEANKKASGVALTYRNITAVEVKVYPVDLMQFYLSRKGLDEVATIDLAGVKPKLQTDLELVDRPDFEEKTRLIELPIEDEGAFLVIVRAGGVFASGIVLVTPLELDVTEQPDGGLLRVAVRDASDGSRVAGVELKVIGSGNGEFVAGQTDLRGVFLAEGLRGQATVVARQGTARYALFRGKKGLGALDQGREERKSNLYGGTSASLEEDLRGQNRDAQRRQIDRFERRAQGMGGGMGGMMGGGFR